MGSTEMFVILITISTSSPFVTWALFVWIASVNFGSSEVVWATFTGVVDVMQVFIGSNNAFRRGLALGTMN